MNFHRKSMNCGTTCNVVVGIINRINGQMNMTEQEAKNIAEPIVKEIVNCISSGQYERISRFATFSNGFSVAIMKELLEKNLTANELSHYDDYDVPFTGNSSQLDVYVFDNGEGFAVDYDLSTDGQPNDLTLQIRFFNNGNGGYNAFVDDYHVL